MSPDVARSAARSGAAVAVVVAAHGSRASGANDAHRALVARVAEAAGEAPTSGKDGPAAVSVVPAFLELTEPSIPDAIDAAVAAGAVRVLVLPYFLHPGRHLLEDLTSIAAAAADRHPTAAIELLDLFGADPVLADLVVAQIRSGLDVGGGADAAR